MSKQLVNNGGLLVIESSTPKASCCLIKQDEIVSYEEGQLAIWHSELLGELAWKVIKNSNTEITNLEGIIVGTGPGSFMGIRVGIALSKGICLGLKIPILGISSYYSLAWEANLEGEIWVIGKAQKETVYIGKFFRTGNLLVMLEDIKIASLYEVIETSGKARIVRDNCPEWTEITGQLEDFLPVTRPRADYLARVGYQLWQKGKRSDIISLQPLYLQPPRVTICGGIMG